MNKTLLRIANDYKDFHDNQPEGIYIHINKEDMKTCYALIIGPEDTSYFGGNYIFKVEFPKKYPIESPKVTFLTIDRKTRINPNLYVTGKVCLSIIGTWPGPSWKPIMNLRYVLISIQSLLCSNPITNEPGSYENMSVKSKSSKNYNLYVSHGNFKLCILDVLEGKIKESKYFNDIIIEEFKKNKDRLEKILNKHEDKVSFKSPIYFLGDMKNNVELDFASQKKRFQSNIKSL